MGKDFTRYEIPTAILFFDVGIYLLQVRVMGESNNLHPWRYKRRHPQLAGDLSLIKLREIAVRHR